MTIQEKIELFLQSEQYAVAGASTNRHKYGNKVLRCYKQHGMNVVAVNPRATVIEELPCIPSVLDSEGPIDAVSIITPPKISYDIVQDCIQKGVKHIWFQPGAENWDAIDEANAAGINVIDDGSCLLVVLGFRESA